MILAEITNFMSVQLSALRPSLNKWSDAINLYCLVLKVCIIVVQDKVVFIKSW